MRTRLNLRARVALTMAVAFLAGACGTGESATTAGETATGATNGSTDQAEPETANELTPVGVGIYGVGLELDFPTFVAEELGLFEENGLQVTTSNFSTGTDMAGAVLGGSVDVGVPAAPAALRLILEQDEDLAILGGGPDTAFSLVVNDDVMARPEAEQDFPDNLAALRGEQLAVIGPGTLTDWWLRRLLTAGGLDPDSDVTIIGAGSLPATLAAFSEGEVAGATSFLTTLPLLGEEGTDFHVLAGQPAGTTGTVMDGYMQSLWTARQSWVQDNPETALAFCRAIHSALDWLTDDANGDQMLDLAEEWLMVERQDAEWMMDTLTYRLSVSPDVWEQQADMVEGSEAPAYDEYVYQPCVDPA